ncbi:unnamed protein product [Enterobius vermicularis]|uniref:Non-specific serine/threonine protein kinase n=1 Tax=Enterobius vermicularis TaxID=51028 RepID=A0A158Q9S3_ENTVE|nr:unnamed protein product [Enterobius vermicularis]
MRVPDGGESLQSQSSFSYNEINVSSTSTLLPLIKLNSLQPFVQVNALNELANLSFEASSYLLCPVYSAISSAINDHISYSVARSCKIAIEVAWNVCCKDFAFDIEKTRYSQSLVSMVYGLTSGMTYVTSRDLLYSRIQKYLVDGLRSVLNDSALGSDKEQILEKLATALAKENIEIATCFVVKAACERAVQEVHKLVSGREKNDARQRLSVELMAAVQQLPEKIRPNSVTSSQTTVYNEYLSNICGFKKLSLYNFARESETANSGQSNSARDIAVQQRDKKIDQFKILLQAIIREIELVLSGSTAQMFKVSGPLSVFREGLVQLLLKPEDRVLQYGFVQKMLCQMSAVFKTNHASVSKKRTDLVSQMENEWDRRLKYIFFNICKAFIFQVGQEDFLRNIVRIVFDVTLQHKFNAEFVNFLTEQGLFQLPFFDRYLAMHISAGSTEAIALARNLVKQGRYDLPLSTESLLKFPFAQSHPGSCLPSVTTNLQLHQGTNSAPVTNVNNFLGKSAGLPVAASSGKANGPKKDLKVKVGRVPSEISKVNVNGVDGNQSLREKAEKVLKEWIQLCYTIEAQRQPERALALIVRVMSELNVISSDAAITEFFHACAYVCADVTYRLLKNDPNAEQATSARQRCYYTLDAFAKLACLMVKCSSDCPAQTKVNLLVKILGAIEEVLCADYKIHGSDFCPMPHQRMFMVMFNELTEPSSSLSPVAWNIIEAFGRALSNLRPRRIPGFAFAWLDIIGHRNFISRLLKSDVEPVKTAAMYTQLLLYQLKFLSPFLRNVEMPKSVLKLYKGTLRILYVIRHDFPELLCEYCCVFCDAIPPNCVHLRNLILSAHPRVMRLPNPYSLDLKAQDLPELSQEPKTQINITNLIPSTLLQQIHGYLTEQLPDTFLSTLPNQLETATQPTSLPGLRYNSTLMNAIILHVGSLATRNIARNLQGDYLRAVGEMRHTRILESLSEDLSNEGRYMLFNGMVDHLRYPCNRTYYFCFALLHLFTEAKVNMVREQIMRTVFERLLAPKPYPWGLLLVAVELIKDPKYNLWGYDFLHCEPRFESFCQRVKGYHDSMVSGMQEGGFSGILGDFSSTCSTPALFDEPVELCDETVSL